MKFSKAKPKIQDDLEKVIFESNLFIPYRLSKVLKNKKHTDFDSNTVKLLHHMCSSLHGFNKVSNDLYKITFKNFSFCLLIQILMRKIRNDIYFNEMVGKLKE